MAKRKLISNLSVEGIKNLQQELRNYKQQLNDKNEIFVKRLAELGIPVINENMTKASFTYDDKGIQSGSNTEHNTYIKVNSFGSYSKADLIVEGKELLFIEFGAGVYYNKSGASPNPKGPEFGYVIGTYGAGHGSQKVWGYYADSGELVLTHGVEATMPVYKASIQIIENIKRIAKEVFGS